MYLHSARLLKCIIYLIFSSFLTHLTVRRKKKTKTKKHETQDQNLTLNITVACCMLSNHGPPGYPEDHNVCRKILTKKKKGWRIHDKSTLHIYTICLTSLKNARTVASHFHKTAGAFVSSSRTHFLFIWCSKWWRCCSWKIHQAKSKSHK